MSSRTTPETKICPRCGRSFANRKKWASRGLWPQIIYCSERCRRGTDTAKPKSNA